MDLRATMGTMTGNPAEDIKTLYNYVFQLTEEFRYLMSNLDVTNFNDLGLARYENGRLQVYSGVVEVRANKIESVVEALGNDLGEFELWTESQFIQTENSISAVVNANGNITPASIVAAINEAKSTVKIAADHVDISGLVTIADLKGNGTTVINGSNITTGEIRAVNFIAKGDINSFIVHDENDAAIGSIGYSVVEDEEEYKDKLWLTTNRYRKNGMYYYPAIKLEAAGGVSIESGGNGVFIYDGSGVEWMFKGGRLYKDGDDTGL